MYKRVLRPLFFLLQPETIHHLVVWMLRTGFAIPGISCLVKRCCVVKHPSLERQLFGLNFENPVGIAAGFDKEAKVFNQLADLGFGHIEIGTVTPKGQPGNPKPRLFRLKQDQALINRMGFNNSGMDAAINNLKKRKTNAIIGGNLGKNTRTPNEEAVADYETLFNGLYEHVDYFVVNVSCPNVSNLRELQDQEHLTHILGRVQKLNHAKPRPKPVLLKISPDLNHDQLDEVITIVKETKIDGIIATNTTVTREPLTSSQERIKSIGNGGLSGGPLTNRSTEVIRYLAKKSNKAFPIIGVGGIFTAEDALEKLEAGADLVQVYTGFIYSGPMIARKINKALIKKAKA